MKILYEILMLSLFLFIWGCGSTKETQTVTEYKSLSELVNSMQFEIEQEWVRPLSGNMINLIGNPNYIRFSENQVDLFLPYFGVRQFGGGYGSEGGIKYVGPAEKLIIEENTEDNSIIIKFEGRQGTENLQFFINILNSGSVQTTVTSSQRNSISYTGNLKMLAEK